MRITFVYNGSVAIRVVEPLGDTDLDFEELHVVRDA